MRVPKLPWDAVEGVAAAGAAQRRELCEAAIASDADTERRTLQPDLARASARINRDVAKTRFRIDEMQQI